MAVRSVAVLLGLLLLAPAGVTGAGAAQPGIVAVPAGTADGQTRLIVALPRTADGRGAPPLSVTVDGTLRPVTTTPLLSDRLAAAVVVDASRDGGPVLQPGVSGVVDLVLGVPGTARAALVADTDPPVVVTPLRAGAAELLDGLSAMQPRGDRRTVAALDLAAAQLPSDAGSPRVVMLYTSAPDAADRSAADLGAGLSAAGIVLAVVTTAADGGPVPPYWSAAAAATGGTAVSVRGPEAVDGFTRLATALQSRYLLTVPAPDRFPATVVVRVDGPDGPLTAETVVSAPPPAPRTPATSDGELGTRAVVGALAVVVLVLLVASVVTARGRVRSGGAPSGGSRSGESRPGPVWDVPALPEPVAAREPLLTDMGRALRPGTPLVLHDDGAEGLGATTAMIEFAHRNRHDYDVAWWVAAEDPPLVRDRLAELAEVLGLAAPDDPADAATDRLRDALSHRNRWLLLFDHPPHPDELAPLLPAGPGHVVVSANDPQWRDHGTTLPVPPLHRTQSVDLLRARHPGLSAAEADRVAAASDDTPLALVPTAATLADTGMSVEGYLRALSTHRTGAGGHATAPSAAWEVALDRLAADDPAALALLTFVAWLAPQPVPLALLTRHPDLLPPPLADAARKPLDLAERAATLQRRGLARVEPDGAGPGITTSGTVALHPTPAAQLRTRAGAQRPGCAASAVRLLHAALSAEPPAPAGGSCCWRRLLPHVLVATDPARDLEEVAVGVSWLLRHAGRYLQARGEARAARALFADAHDLYRQRLGDDHPDTVAAARDLA